MAEAAAVGRWQRSLGLASLILFGAGPGLAHLEILPPIAGFGLFVLGSFLGLIVLVVGLLTGFRKGLRRGQTAVLLGAIPGLSLVWLVTNSGDHPRINDVSTDLDRPPRFLQAQAIPANRDRDLSYPSDFVPIVRSAYPDLKPLVLSDPPGKVFDRALLIARGSEGWRVTLVDGEQLTFEGVATSRLFRFQDDFVVRIAGEDGGTRVDMRSKSRDGQGDVGANAARIREFLGKLKAIS